MSAFRNFFMDIARNAGIILIPLSYYYPSQGCILTVPFFH